MSPGEYLKKPYGRVVVPESDGSFRAEINEFPGCIAVGDTAQDALANLEGIAASWLQATLAKGQTVPPPIENSEYSGKLVLRLARSVHKKAALQAAREGVSLNTFIANGVAEQVGARSASLGHQSIYAYAIGNLNVLIPAQMLVTGSNLSQRGVSFANVSSGQFQPPFGKQLERENAGS